MTKRISINAASTILRLIEHTEGLDIFLDGEKIEPVVEEFLIARCSQDGPTSLAKSF